MPEEIGHLGHNPGHQHKPWWRTYLPLMVVFALIALFTWLRQGPVFDPNMAMGDFMAGFFLLFGGFKLLNIKAFAELFRSYDLLASRVPGYAFAYPFLELGLGISYGTGTAGAGVYIATILIMVIGALGAAMTIRRSHGIRCACLGSWAAIPLSWVTVAEDVLMAAMAVTLYFRL